jgi:hypothetical protein
MVDLMSLHPRQSLRGNGVESAEPSVTYQMNEVQRAVIERYAKALQFRLSYVPSDDTNWNRTIVNEHRDAAIEVREHGLEGTPEYNHAVLRAEQFAQVILSRRPLPAA